MDSRKQKLLSYVENVLYIIIVTTIITDILSRQAHQFIFIVSTVILGAAILGIISIELIKLQLKLKQRR